MPSARSSNDSDVSDGDAAEIIEAAEAALDDVSAFVGAFAQRMDDDAVGFVGDDRLCAVLDDPGARFVAVIAFVSEQRAHGRNKHQHIGRGGDVGAHLLYLPPYSPDLNPIEQLFAKLKAFLGKTAARSFTALFDAFASALAHVSPDECANYFDAAGYSR